MAAVPLGITYEFQASKRVEGGSRCLPSKAAFFFFKLALQLVRS